MRSRKRGRGGAGSGVADAHMIERFSETPGVWITVTGAAFYNLYYKRLETIELKPSLVTALAFIEQYSGITQSELGRKMKINRASAMQISNALSDLNLITRSQLARLNQVALEITPQGASKLVEACNIEQDISNEVLNDLDEQQKSDFVRILKGITQKVGDIASRDNIS